MLTFHPAHRQSLHALNRCFKVSRGKVPDAINDHAYFEVRVEFSAAQISGDQLPIAGVIRQADVQLFTEASSPENSWVDSLQIV